MLLSECAHGLHHRRERAALVGEAVLDAGRLLGEFRAMDEPAFFKCMELLREGARARAGERRLEVSETLRPGKEIPDDEERRRIADDISSLREGAVPADGFLLFLGAEHG